MNYNYKHEMGAIIGANGDILRLVEGGVGSVNFPSDVIWELHKQSPGIIYTIAHTHPPGFDSLSTTDMKLFEGWAWALYPFPIRMQLLTEEHEDVFYTKPFKSISYFGQLESKEEWIARGKEGKRKFSYQVEEIHHFSLDYTAHFELWEGILLESSYERQENGKN